MRVWARLRYRRVDVNRHERAGGLWAALGSPGGNGGRSSDARHQTGPCGFTSGESAPGKALRKATAKPGVLRISRLIGGPCHHVKRGEGGCRGWCGGWCGRERADERALGGDLAGDLGGDLGASVGQALGRHWAGGAKCGTLATALRLLAYRKPRLAGGRASQSLSRPYHAPTPRLISAGEPGRHAGWLGVGGSVVGERQGGAAARPAASKGL